jgi:hypothetical protein
MLKTLPRLLALQTCDQHIREIVHSLESLQASLVALEEQAHASVTEQQRYRDKIHKAKQVRDALGKETTLPGTNTPVR